MAKRISKADLENLVNRLNIVAGQNPEPWIDGEWNIGSYVLSGAYGGYNLGRIDNDAGGAEEIFDGHVSKADAYNRFNAFLDGFITGKEGAK